MPRRPRNDTPANAPAGGAAASGSAITDYRHADKRKNIPPAGLAAQGKLAETPRTRFAYDPHLPPVLRFDPSGASDSFASNLGSLQSIAKTPTTGRTCAIDRQ